MKEIYFFCANTEEKDLALKLINDNFHIFGSHVLKTSHYPNDNWCVCVSSHDDQSAFNLGYLSSKQKYCKI